MPLYKKRFHSELTKVRTFLFYGQDFWRIYDRTLNIWRLGMYTSEETARPYVDKLNKDYSNV